MLFAVSMFVLTACDGCGEKITDKPQEQIETYINLSLAEKQMIVGDEETLVAYTPVIEDLTITWASSDERIVSVNNGVITAVRPGTADITATFGDKTDSCKVTVGLGSQLPVIEFENQIVNDNLYVAKNGDVNLGAFIKFNNKIFNDATFTYTRTRRSQEKLSLRLKWPLQGKSPALVCQEACSRSHQSPRH